MTKVKARGLDLYEAYKWVYEFDIPADNVNQFVDFFEFGMKLDRVKFLTEQSQMSINKEWYYRLLVDLFEKSFNDVIGIIKQHIARSDLTSDLTAHIPLAALTGDTDKKNDQLDLIHLVEMKDEVRGIVNILNNYGIDVSDYIDKASKFDKVSITTEVYKRLNEKFGFIDWNESEYPDFNEIGLGLLKCWLDKQGYDVENKSKEFDDTFHISKWDNRYIGIAPIIAQAKFIKDGREPKLHYDSDFEPSHHISVDTSIRRDGLRSILKNRSAKNIEKFMTLTNLPGFEQYIRELDQDKDIKKVPFQALCEFYTRGYKVEELNQIKDKIRHNNKIRLMDVEKMLGEKQKELDLA